MTISEKDARRVAGEDAQQVYTDLSGYEVAASRDGDVWRVTYRLADPLTVGGGPEYVISAETGEILERQYYQ